MSLTGHQDAAGLTLSQRAYRPRVSPCNPHMCELQGGPLCGTARFRPSWWLSSWVAERLRRPLLCMKCLLTIDTLPELWSHRYFQVHSITPWPLTWTLSAEGVWQHLLSCLFDTSYPPPPRTFRFLCTTER